MPAPPAMELGQVDHLALPLLLGESGQGRGGHFCDPKCLYLWYTNGVEIARSAHRHGVPIPDMLHALAHALREVELDDDRWLILGPDRAANILELILLVTDQGDERLVHADRASKENLEFL